MKQADSSKKTSPILVTSRNRLPDIQLVKEGSSFFEAEFETDRALVQS